MLRNATVRAFRWKPAVSKAALKGFIQARLLHLEISDLKMGGVEGKILFGRRVGCGARELRQLLYG